MILPIYVYFNGQRLAVFLISFLILQSFLGLKLQKSTFFKEKMFLEYIL